MKWRIASAVIATAWVGILIVQPVLTYGTGTARNVSVRLIEQPYVDSPSLTYEWSGDIYRSCDIGLRRQIVDAFGQVHRLEDSQFPAKPINTLGPVSTIINVPVGPNIPPGPAVYEVIEIPRCNWIEALWPASVSYPPLNFTVTEIEK